MALVVATTQAREDVMARQVVKGIVTRVTVELVNAAAWADRVPDMMPARIQVSGKAWLDDGTEADVDFMRLSPQRDREVRDLFDAIARDLIGAGD